MAAAVTLCFSACAAPIVPQRTKPGGSARWAEAVVQQKVGEWASGAELCRLAGAGVGIDGWLPDRGGTWQLYYWSPTKPSVLELTVDSDGAVKKREIPNDPGRGHSITASWEDSLVCGSATRTHQKLERCTPSMPSWPPAPMPSDSASRRVANSLLATRQHLCHPCTERQRPVARRLLNATRFPQLARSPRWVRLTQRRASILWQPVTAIALSPPTAYLSGIGLLRLPGGPELLLFAVQLSDSPRRSAHDDS